MGVLLEQGLRALARCYKHVETFSFNGWYLDSARGLFNMHVCQSLQTLWGTQDKLPFCQSSVEGRKKALSYPS